MRWVPRVWERVDKAPETRTEQKGFVLCLESYGLKEGVSPEGFHRHAFSVGQPGRPWAVTEMPERKGSVHPQSPAAGPSVVGGIEDPSSGSPARVACGPPPRAGAVDHPTPCPCGVGLPNYATSHYIHRGDRQRGAVGERCRHALSWIECVWDHPRV